MKRPSAAVLATGVVAVVAGLLVVGRSPHTPGAMVVRPTTPTTSIVGTTTTGAPASTAATTTTEVTARRDVVVVVANATDERGVAAAFVDRLRVYDYTSVTAVDAADVTDRTVVYFAVGFKAAARRLALDAGLAASSIAPIANAPLLEDDVLTQLLVVVGADSL